MTCTYTLQIKVESKKSRMGQISTTDTTDSINVAMTVRVDCLNDRYTAEIPFSTIKVWNEGTKLFCAIHAEMIVVDSEDLSNTVEILVEDNKLFLPSLEKDITYSYDDDIVKVEAYTSKNDAQRTELFNIVDRFLEIYVRIEGI